MITKNFQKRVFTSFILFILVILMINFKLISTYVIILFGVMSLLEFLQISKKIFLKAFLRFLVNLVFLIYLFIFCFLFLFFSDQSYLKLILYMIIFGCVASDIGGFICGKTFKGPKLTKISPKKTYSGALGSIFFTCVTISSIMFFFTNSFSYKIIIISIFTSISCQLGDLIFSFIKRKAKIKDTGNILPGHGGILDRLDGMLVGVPIGFITLIMITQ
tara:strand:- start:1938 stop:2591 length:654 start_codon:yes stop_codon:yes gene_type:complete